MHHAWSVFPLLPRTQCAIIGFNSRALNWVQVCAHARERDRERECVCVCLNKHTLGKRSKRTTTNNALTGIQLLPAANLYVSHIMGY